MTKRILDLLYELQSDQVIDDKKQHLRNDDSETSAMISNGFTPRDPEFPLKDVESNPTFNLS